nr:immunoglobulin light chain junction region [Macaca mulatta]
CNSDVGSNTNYIF